MSEFRRYAWVEFASRVRATVGATVVGSAKAADEMLVEFDKRFGPVVCPQCKGTKTIPSANGSPHAETPADAAEWVPVTCPACRGRGKVSREGDDPYSL